MPMRTPPRVPAIGMVAIRKEKETDTLEVNSLEGTVAKTNTDSTTCEAHGGRDWKGELREDENGDGGAHLHG